MMWCHGAMRHILPPLGDLVVAELTAEQLRGWLATLAARRRRCAPRQARSNISQNRRVTKRCVAAAPAPIAC